MGNERQQDLNDRQQDTRGLLGKKSGSHGIKLLRGQ